MCMTIGILRASQTEKDGLVWCLVIHGCVHTSPAVQISAVFLWQISPSSLSFGLWSSLLSSHHGFFSYETKPEDVLQLLKGIRATWPAYSLSGIKAHNAYSRTKSPTPASTPQSYSYHINCHHRHVCVKNHHVVPWKVCLLYAQSYLYPLIASFQTGILLWKAMRAERWTNFPSCTAAQMFWKFDSLGWGVNGARRKSPNYAVCSTQQWQAQGWPDFGMHWSSTPHKTLDVNICKWINNEVLGLQPAMLAQVFLAAAHSLIFWHIDYWGCITFGRSLLLCKRQVLI